MLFEDLNAKKCSKPKTVALDHSTHNEEMEQVKYFSFLKE